MTNELGIYEMETDKKRGPGVHGQILKAMENLRGVGLAFGVTVTDFLKNINVMLDDLYIDVKKMSLLQKLRSKENAIF